MSRIQYHREHKVEPEVKDRLEQEAVDCALEDDEEMEHPELREAEPTVEPGMAEEIEGLDEDISPIERWQASFIAHEAATADRRLPPAIEEHPDGHKSTKMLERQNQDLMRQMAAGKSKEAREMPLGTPIVRKGAPPRSMSVGEELSRFVVPPKPMVHVRLLLFGECKRVIPGPSGPICGSSADDQAGCNDRFRIGRSDSGRTTGRWRSRPR
jgi:hypothetical protein